jgi:hypothetical protein
MFSSSRTLIQSGMLQQTILQQTYATTYFLSIKSGCYNECGGIVFIMGSSIIVFTKERLFMLFKVTCTVYKI